MPIATPWLRRHQRRMVWLLGVLLAVPAVAATVWFLLTGDARAFMLMILMTLANVVNIINPLTVRRLKRRIREHHGLVCVRCLFPLEGLMPEGRCPECGAAYEHAATVEAWKRDLAMQADAALIRAASTQTVSTPPAAGG